MVRAANAGVSGAIDAAGRVLAETGTFTRAPLVTTVHLRTRGTPYRPLGDWPGWLGVLGVAWASGPRWRRGKGRSHRRRRLEAIEADATRPQGSA